MKHLMILMLGSLIALVSSQSHAASIVKVTYSLNGKTIALMVYTGPDGGRASDPSTYWALLDKAPQSAYEVKIKPNKSNDKTATLKGKISVSIKIRNKFSMGTVEIDELKLVRDDNKSDKWYVPPAELKRIIENEFIKVMEAPTEYDDNFKFAVIAVSNEQKSAIARNYIRAGSSANIKWLKDHPERRGARLFRLEGEKSKPTTVSYSTRFGFIPNSERVWFLPCNSSIQFQNTRTKKILEKELEHTLASECSGPNPAISPDGLVMATQTKDSLRFWDLKTLKAISPELKHKWSSGLEFSSDGKWFFVRGRGQIKILEPKTGKLVAGPFPHNLIDRRFSYYPKPQLLATFKNNDENDAWRSAAVIHWGKDWSNKTRFELVGHARTAEWIDDTQLLIVADNKRPGQKPPYTYGRKLVYVVSMAMKDRPTIEKVFEENWISKVAIAPDKEHFIANVRNTTTCFKVGEKKPVWVNYGRFVSFGGSDWAVLQEGERVSVRSLASGGELWRKDNVITSRVQGSKLWIFSEKSVEVWQPIKKKESRD